MRIVYTIRTGNLIHPVGIGWDEVAEHLASMHVLLDTALELKMKELGKSKT